MIVQFKFDIGDAVEHVMRDPPDARLWEIGIRESHAKLCILQRHMDQCWGGVQLAYTVRAVAASGALRVDPFRVFEFEVRAYQPQPDAPAVPPEIPA